MRHTEVELAINLLAKKKNKIQNQYLTFFRQPNEITLISNS